MPLNRPKRLTWFACVPVALSLLAGCSGKPDGETFADAKREQTSASADTTTPQAPAPVAPVTAAPVMESPNAPPATSPAPIDTRPLWPPPSSLAPAAPPPPQPPTHLPQQLPTQPPQQPPQPPLVANDTTFIPHAPATVLPDGADVTNIAPAPVMSAPAADAPIASAPPSDVPLVASNPPNSDLNPLRRYAAAAQARSANPLRAELAPSIDQPSAAMEPSGGAAPPQPRSFQRSFAADAAPFDPAGQEAAPPPDVATAPPPPDTRSFIPYSAEPPPSDPPAVEAAPAYDAAPPAMAMSAASAAPPIASEQAAPPPSEPVASVPAAAEPPPSPVVESTKDYDVVRVFYGTDRQSILPTADRAADIALRGAPALGCLLVTMLFTLIAVLRRSLALSAAAFCGAAITAGLAYSATSATIANYRIAAKEGLRYTAERAEGGAVQVGVCEVTIPRSHQTGELEAPSIVRLEVAEKADRHVILRKTERLEDQKFYDELRARVDRSPRKELFVFVHGFNVPFEDAARRTAQMAYDLKYEGAPVFFSWPANDKLLLTYAKDETNVAWAAPHLKQFLLDVVHHTDAQSINLIAHSMGNRALTAALRDLSLELRDQSRLFNQVVLAAPDIDADDFKLNIAPAIARTANRITVYASSHDQALAASQMVHQYPRAGDSIVLVPGIDTIDVSAIDGGPWGHSYYGSSDPILQDIGQLLLAAPAADRQWLTSSQQNGMTYWVLRTETAATAPQIPYR